MSTNICKVIQIEKCFHKKSKLNIVVDNKRGENKWLINNVEELVYIRANFLMANLSKQKKIQIMINEIACDDFYIITTVNNKRGENKWLIDIVE